MFCWRTVKPRMELWKEVTSIQQGEKSFRQFCLRFLRRLEQFQSLAVTEQVSGLSLDEFQEVGVAYQEAHGRPNKTQLQNKSRKPSQQAEGVSSTQVWKVT